MAAIKSAILEWDIDTRPYCRFAIYADDSWNFQGKDLGDGRAGLAKVLDQWLADTDNGSFRLKQQYDLEDLDADVMEESKVLDVVNNTTSSGTYYIQEISGPGYQAGTAKPKEVKTIAEVIDVLAVEFPALELGPAPATPAALTVTRGIEKPKLS